MPATQTPHVPSQPVGVALPGTGATKAFLSTLNILDRSFSRTLVEKYGNENYTFLLQMLGKYTETQNTAFYHYEKRRNMPAVKVASTSGGTTGATAAVTIDSSSHYDSGTKSPIRVGEVYMIDTTGIQGKVLSVSKVSANAHVANIAPLLSTDAFNPGAGAFLLPMGKIHEGEASDKTDGIQPIVDRITQTVTEIREDYQITDKGAMEKIEFDIDGQSFYRRYGTTEAEKRFLNSRELGCLYGINVTNTNITSNGTVGAKGLIQQIVDGGSTLQYTASSMNGITDFQLVTRTLTFNGASAELHQLCDVYQFQELQRTLFNQYPNGAIQWGSVGGGAEIAAKLGFSSYAIDGFTFHFKKYAPFSPEWMYGVTPASASKYKNYALIIPQGFSTVQGNTYPVINLRFMKYNGQEINAWETGGMASQNKTSKAEVWNHFLGYYGLEVSAPNQCAIFQGV